LAEVRRSIERDEERRRFFALYPEAGQLSRHNYPKHLEFFSLGREHQERAFIAGNRVGKTTAAGYELVAHATGLYPEWWPGFRFSASVEAWACGTDAKSVRDTIQDKLLGKPAQWGTGLIPGDLIIGKPTPGGVPESVDTVRVRHCTGGVSEITFKNYEQDRESYQGATKKVVWFDEEPPMYLYTEGLTRTMSTVPGEPNGRVLCTFTPLLGLSEVVLAFLPGGKAA
jgi:phage terminase large subunit-like protein